MPAGCGRALAAVALAAALGGAGLLGGGGCRRSRPRIARSDAAVVVMQAPLPVPPGVTTVLREAAPSTGDQPPMPIDLPEGGSIAVEGSLTLASEEDLYLVQLQPAAPASAPASGGPPTPPDGGQVPTQQISVEITPSADLATRLLLRDAALYPPGKAGPQEGPVLASSRASVGKRHGLPNAAAAVGGRYLLSVRRAEARTKEKRPAPEPAPYLLVLRAGPLGAADEREPNDTPTTATASGAAHTEPQLAGYLGGPGDRDFYRVPFGHVSGSARLLVELAPSADGAATLTASDPLGRRVAQARARRGERAVLRGLTPDALTAPGQPGAGFFYVEVATEGAGDPFRRYVLGVRSDPAPESDTPDTAVPRAASP